LVLLLRFLFLMLLFQGEWCFCPLCNDEIKRVAEAKPEGGEEAEYWRYKRAELISMYALLTAPIKNARPDFQQPRAYKAVAPFAQPGPLSSGETCGLLAKQPSPVLLRVAFGVFLFVCFVARPRPLFLLVRWVHEVVPVLPGGFQQRMRRAATSGSLQAGLAASDTAARSGFSGSSRSGGGFQHKPKAPKSGACVLS
jgi:hypothetical protein